MKRVLPVLILLGGIISASAQDLDLPVHPSFTTQTKNLPAEEIKAPDRIKVGPAAMDGPRYLPPPVFYGEEITTESDTIVYILDRSSSMRMVTSTKEDGEEVWLSRWEQAKRECLRSIEGLSRQFRFNIIVFDCTILTWSAKAKSATHENVEAATAWLMSKHPGGSTGTGPAVVSALSNSENRLLILLTDGDPTCPGGDVMERLRIHRSMIRVHNTQNAKISVFGIAAVGEWRGFCTGVAADNNGEFHDIP